MSLHALQSALRKARGTRPRREIAERAGAVIGGVDLDEKAIQNHEHRMATPPANGERLRTHAAAVGLLWVPCLELMSYWPPLLIGAPSVKMELLREWCRQHGAQIAREDAESRRVVVQL